MTQKHRIEKDTMGEMRVPEDARYGAQTARAVANFPVSGQPLPALVVRALGVVKAAAAVVNERQKLLEPELARVIREAAEEVVAGQHDRHFPIDVFQTGSGTSSNMNANEVIAHRANELLGRNKARKAVHPNDHVNLGQSSNDVFPSAVQLALIMAWEEKLRPELSALAAALHDFADRTFDVVKTGRTHLMDAMPIRLGQEFRGYAGHVEAGMERIRQSVEGLRELPLGGTAVGTGVNSRPGLAAAMCREIAERRGFDVRETRNHFQAQAGLDAVVQCSASMRTFATALYKVANDIRWMASSVVGELRIPAVQPGSSIMPAKVNPVICESVLMVCAQVIGNDLAVAFGNSQGQFELNTMMPMMARNALESAVLLASACAILREKCLQGTAPGASAGAAVHRNPILATALNERIGYEAAAAIAKEAAASGRTVREVAAERTGLDAATLDELLDPKRLCGEWGRER
jgi:fumarate hydratase class II